MEGQSDLDQINLQAYFSFSIDIGVESTTSWICGRCLNLWRRGRIICPKSQEDSFLYSRQQPQLIAKQTCGEINRKLYFITLVSSGYFEGG